MRLDKLQGYLPCRFRIKRKIYSTRLKKFYRIVYTYLTIDTSQTNFLFIFSFWLVNLQLRGQALLCLIVNIHCWGYNNKILNLFVNSLKTNYFNLVFYRKLNQVTITLFETFLLLNARHYYNKIYINKKKQHFVI